MTKPYRDEPVEPDPDAPDADAKILGVSRSPWHVWMVPSGRIPRSTYWRAFMLPIGLASAIASIVSTELYGLIVLLSFWPGVVGLVKRAHDLDYSTGRVVGVWIWLVFFSFSGGLNLDLLFPALAIGFLPALVLGLLCGFKPGTKGSNRFGEDPLA